VLDKGCSLTWNPNLSDMELIASLKDIIEAMAEVTETPITWTGVNAKSEDERHDTFTTATQRRRKKLGKGGVGRPALHIVCNTNEALNDARVLQTETAMCLGKVVSTNGSSVDMKDVEAVAVLLTKEALYVPAVLVELFEAIVAEKTLVPVCLIGRGYDYASASLHLADLAPGLGTDKLDELDSLLDGLLDATGVPATVEALQLAICTTLPLLIAVNWEPEAGKNQLDAAVNNVVSRIKASEAKVPALKLGSAITAISPSRRLLGTADSARKSAGNDRSSSSDPVSSAKTPKDRSRMPSQRSSSPSSRNKGQDAGVDATKLFGASSVTQGAETAVAAAPEAAEVRPAKDGAVVTFEIAPSSEDTAEENKFLTWRAPGKDEENDASADMDVPTAPAPYSALSV